MDAASIAAAQKLEHYEIAGYGTVRTWATQLGYDDVAELLQETLDEEVETDKKLTPLASSVVNEDAFAEGEDEAEDEEEDVEDNEEEVDIEQLEARSTLRRGASRR